MEYTCPAEWRWWPRRRQHPLDAGFRQSNHGTQPGQETEMPTGHNLTLQGDSRMPRHDGPPRADPRRVRPCQATPMMGRGDKPGPTMPRSQPMRVGMIVAATDD